MRSIVKQADYFNLRTAEPVAAPPAPAAPKTYQPIYKEDLSTPDARRSRPVSHGEFQQLAGEGERRINNLKSATPQSTAGIDNNWNSVVADAYKQTREPWGGATYHPGTGQAIKPNGSDQYVLTARDPGKKSVELHPNASADEFSHAMNHARQYFSDELSRPGHHLGVFHDADVNKVQIDPTYVTPHHSDVESMGAFTRNVGGAYNMKDGNGYWPPHTDPSLG